MDLVIVLFAFSSFFVCKQKTAYEMRSSYWSSDVCSSDLRGEEAKRRPDRRRAIVAVDIGMAVHVPVVGDDRVDIAGKLDHGHIGMSLELIGVAAGRTSVVLGKRVAVRVDRGGRRTIKTTRHDVRTECRS